LTQDGTVELTQERFFHFEAASEDKNTQLWHVPISYALFKQPYSPGAPKSSPQSVIFNATTMSLPLKSSINDTACDVLKINVNHVGFYRVQYDAEWIKRIAECTVKYGAGPNGLWLSQADVAGLLDDSFNLALAGRYAISAPMTLLDALKENSGKLILVSFVEFFVDYGVWQTGLTYMKLLGSYISGNQELSALWEQHILKVVGPMVEKVGWSRKKETHTMKLLRPELLNYAARLGVEVRPL
jgi:hypothetical protein